MALLSCAGTPPSTDRFRPPRPDWSAEVDSTDAGTGAPVGSLAGTYVNAPGLLLNSLSCCSGLIASRSIVPVEASLVGSATVWFAFAPVTRTSPLPSDDASSGRPPAFLSRVAPSSDIRSTTAASPLNVPSTGAPLVGPDGRFAVPVRLPATPPGLVHSDDRGSWSQPRMPKRCSW